jgi:hypothetical protein
MFPWLLLPRLAFPWLLLPRLLRLLLLTSYFDGLLFEIYIDAFREIDSNRGLMSDDYRFLIWQIRSAHHCKNMYVFPLNSAKAYFELQESWKKLPETF